MEEKMFLPSRPNLSKLNVGDRVLVTFKDISRIYYAVYSDFDQFDVHRSELDNPDGHRGAWYKYTSISVRQFCKL